MKRKILKSISIWLVCSILLCTGCGTNKKSVNKNAENSTENSNETSDLSKAMGRYVETENDVLEEAEVSSRLKMVKMQDGSFTVMDTYSGKWISKDNGETWEQEIFEWYDELCKNAYIMDAAVSPDGYIGVIYEMNPEDNDAAGTEEFNLSPQCKLVAPDGTELDFEIPYEDMEYPEKFCFSEDGRLFVSTLGGKVYEVNKEDGSAKMLVELSDWVFHMDVLDDRMICVNSTGVTIIDLTTKEVVEDKVLDDFISTSFGAQIEFLNMTVLPLLPILAEDNIIYLVCDKGVYRHVIGGSAIEQVVDGALTSLNNPSNGIVGGVLLEDDVFLILVSSGKLFRYTYDPNMPTVPNVQLKAYSLTENAVLRQSISVYQTKHPEVFIKYEIGIEANSAMTREDALKKLNAEIVAGSGPDLMVLDDMPIDSYVNKGILMDLSPYIDKIIKEEEVFTNVFNVLKSESGTYAVPAQFKLPVIVGKESTLNHLTNLTALADEVEKIRKTKPEGSITGAVSEESMLAKLQIVSAPAWKVNNKLDEKVLTDFFTEAKRIWDAESSGITDTQKDDYYTMQEQWTASGMNQSDIREQNLSLDMLKALSNHNEISMGTVQGGFGFDMMTSVLKEKDMNFMGYSGQVSNAFIPKTIIGISAKTSFADEVGELLQLIVSKDGGSDWGAWPVNKEVMKENIILNETSDGSSYGSVMVSDEEGTTLALDIYSASEEESNQLLDVVENVKTPYIYDSALEDVISEIGVKILKGEMSVDDGVSKIIKDTAIYMAE